jgi:hypothetical protein
MNANPYPADETPEQQPDLSITHDERGLTLWVSVPALAAARIADGPNGPAAPFGLDVDSVHTLISALQLATDDRDALRDRDNLD